MGRAYVGFFAVVIFAIGCGRRGEEVSLASADVDASPAGTRTGTGTGAGAGADAAADDRWRSADGNFAVAFPYPDEPKIETRPITGGFEHVAKVTGEFGTYLVGYDDTLKFAGPRPSKQVLDSVMASTLKANQGKLEKQTPITLAGKHPGRAFEASLVAKDKRKIKGTFHLYVVRTRVYQVVALTPTDKTVPPERIERFFTSFGLLEPR